MKLWSSLVLIAIVAVTSCKVETKQDEIAADGRLQIVCTTGMIGDAVSEITADMADVEVLMGPGVDPHLYKATQNDLERLSDAQVIFYSGLHLEGKIGDVLDNLAQRKHVFCLADGLDQSRFIKMAEFDDAYDPHIWFDVEIWSDIVQVAADHLAKIDPTRAEAYQTNCKAYRDKLAALYEQVQNKVAELPEERRIMITAHDAFEYFARSTKFQVRGLQGISTTAGIGVHDVKELVSFIIEKDVHAIFVESSVPERALASVLEGCREQGHEVRLGGTLYSDALGEAGTPQGTYLGMIEYNVNTIVDALNVQDTTETE